jgi:hypothetical protein
VFPDAEWCGQCYQPLLRAIDGGGRSTASREPADEEPGALTRVAEPPSEGGGAEATGPTWDCPTCGTRHPFDVDRCPLCGTPFARLFEEPTPGPRIGPSTALAWSIVPGLGHWKAGRRSDGAARVILFLWVFGTVVLLLASRSGTGLGPFGALFGLYALATLALWAESAVDAYRVAAGRPPLVPARTLLWGCVALVVLSVLVATLVALPAARGA